MLSSTYAGLFAASKEWGKANDEQKADFRTKMDRFIHNLTAALESTSGGLELSRSSAAQIESYETMDTSNFSQRISQNPEIIPHFEELLDEWCDQTEEYLEARRRTTVVTERPNRGSSGVPRPLSALLSMLGPRVS